MQLAKIVVAIDFSDEADIAVTEALNIARHTGAEVVLLHAMPIADSGSLPESMKDSITKSRELMRELLNDSRKELDELRERIIGQGVEVSHMVIDSLPASGIVDAAEELDADLVVMGTHGRTGIRRILLGSVAERVVRLCHRHVLIARDGGDNVGGYKHILVPTDFSPAAETGLELALAMVADGGTIDLLHCWEIPGAPARYFGSSRVAESLLRSLADDIEANVSGEFNKLIENHAREGVTLNPISMRQPPTKGIDDRLQSSDYDLVIVGSHGRKGITRFILGSVAETTVRHANCSVVVTHKRPPASDE